MLVGYSEGKGREDRKGKHCTGLRARYKGGKDRRRAGGRGKARSENCAEECNTIGMIFVCIGSGLCVY